MKDINPPIELVRQWAAAAAGSNNPSKYMRECYLQYGYEQGARVALADAFTDKRELWEMVATCTARSCISAHYSSLTLRVVADWVEQRMEQAAVNGWNYEPWRIVNDLRIAAHTADAAIEADETLPRWAGEMQ